MSEFQPNDFDSTVNQQYYRKSASGRYTIAKTMTDGVWIYLAWCGKKLLGVFADYGAAQAHCAAATSQLAQPHESTDTPLSKGEHHT